MSLDKLIAAATDYFSTGAEVHRRALAGGGGKITDMSEPKVGTTSDTAKPKAEKPKADAVTRGSATKVQGPEAVTDVVAKPVPDAAPEVYNNTISADDLDGGTPALDYEADIRPVLRAKTLTHREGLIALLGTFGVKSGAELTAAQYPAFFAGLKAL
jgi:hypothetical protein